MPIIDTHQHLWNISRQRLAWLASAPEVLRASYGAPEYAEATRGLDIRAVYMEVDVVAEDRIGEAEHVLGLCERPDSQTVAAVIGGHPAEDGFIPYIERFAQSSRVKGVRQVLHGDSTPAGYCLGPEFVRGVQWLGSHDLRFDLCLRPGELADGAQLCRICPDTRFIVDHCGNADPKAFATGSAAAGSSHDAEDWRRAMGAFAERPNVICKISGIVARAPRGWTAEDLAPIVNHCLDSFGPDRVVFGSDWPVCLPGASLQHWVEALQEIVSQRPQDQQHKLWSQNAIAFYGLDAKV